MAESRIQRKLAAILCADVVGYSRLMGENDEATLEALTDNKQVFYESIEKHVATLESSVKRFPAFISGRVALASSYCLMGKHREAKQEVAEILRRDPTYTIARYTTPNLYRNKETMEKWAASLRKAGLPE